jgi:hypothetical protein
VKATRAIANFDSASAMVRALASFLHGRDFPHLGVTAPPRPVARLVNALPARAREQVYIWSGAAEALPPRRLGLVRAEEIARWVAACYPRRAYPAAMIGSSNGAAVHLCAALGIPWLPQTFLIPVRHGGKIDKDEPREAMAWGARQAPPLLARNPELQLHHMHDSNQDRLMISRMAYFRVKRLRLGDAYAGFLRAALPRGATLFVLDCTRTWRTTAVADRHVFQHGALGGAYAEEYEHGGERVSRFLEREGASRRSWDPPESDAERPEAEWGFEYALLDDIERLARQRHWQIRRITFEEPEHLSPFVADLYRAWYRERGLPADRLLVESFILLEPYWVLRTARAFLDEIQRGAVRGVRRGVPRRRRALRRDPGVSLLPWRRVDRNRQARPVERRAQAGSRPVPVRGRGRRCLSARLRCLRALSGRAEGAAGAEPPARALAARTTRRVRRVVRGPVPGDVVVARRHR